MIVTGYDLGMDTAGGFGQYIRVPSSWAVPLPVGLSMYCLLYTSPSPRDRTRSRMPSSA